jgi:hypothetical protein
MKMGEYVVAYTKGRIEDPVMADGPAIAELTEAVFTELQRYRAHARQSWNVSLERSLKLYDAAAIQCQCDASGRRIRLRTPKQLRARVAWDGEEIAILQGGGSHEVLEIMDRWGRDPKKLALMLKEWTHVGIGVGACCFDRFICIVFGKHVGGGADITVSSRVPWPARDGASPMSPAWLNEAQGGA